MKNTFEPTSLSFDKVIVRFYLMIAVTVIFGFMGQWILAAIFGYAIGFSAIVGLGRKNTEKTTIVTSATVENNAKVIPFENETELRKAS